MKFKITEFQFDALDRNLVNNGVWFSSERAKKYFLKQANGEYTFKKELSKVDENIIQNRIICQHEIDLSHDVSLLIKKAKAVAITGANDRSEAQVKAFNQYIKDLEALNKGRVSDLICRSFEDNMMLIMRDVVSKADKLKQINDDFKETLFKTKTSNPEVKGFINTAVHEISNFCYNIVKSVCELFNYHLGGMRNKEIDKWEKILNDMSEITSVTVQKDNGTETKHEVHTPYKPKKHR